LKPRSGRRAGQGGTHPWKARDFFLVIIPVLFIIFVINTYGTRDPVVSPTPVHASPSVPDPSRVPISPSIGTASSSPGTNATPSPAPTSPSVANPSPTPRPEPSPQYYKPFGSSEMYYRPSEEDFRSGRFSEEDVRLPEESRVIMDPWWPPHPWKPLATVPPDAGDIPNSLYERGIAQQVIEPGTTIVRYIPYPENCYPECCLWPLAIVYAKLRDWEYAEHLCVQKCAPPYDHFSTGCLSQIIKEKVKYNLTWAVELAKRGEGIIMSEVIPAYYERYGLNRTLEMCMPDGSESSARLILSKYDGCIRGTAHEASKTDLELAKDLCRMYYTEKDNFGNILITSGYDHDFDSSYLSEEGTRINHERCIEGSEYTYNKFHDPGVSP